MAGTRHGTRVVRGPRPTARGYSLLVTGVVVLAGSVTWWRQDLLLLGLALVLFPLASMLAVTMARPRLAVARSLAPDIVTAGEETTVVITLRNAGGSTPSILAWRDLTPKGIGEHARETFRIAAGSGFAAGRGSLELRHTVRTEGRGMYPIGPVALVLGDPFGLARRERALGPTASLVVTPRVDPLTADDLGAAAGDGSDREVLRRANPGADEVIAREYRTGDPLRRVHWRATARLGELMVRQEEQHSDPDAWILFDTCAADPTRTAHPSDVLADPQFERAVRLVASLGTALLGFGYRVRVVETGSPQLAGFSSRGGGRETNGGISAARAVASFERSGGRRALLVALATVEQRQRANDSLAAVLLGGLRKAGASAPVFAVLLGDPERYQDPLGEVASVSGPATAFLASKAMTAQERLVNAGWTVAAFPRPGTPHG
jgi:uncharacterized protein (DUF58 family)